jgi:glycosyltransferase involved in cell wall biosynthesis
MMGDPAPRNLYAMAMDRPKVVRVLRIADVSGRSPGGIRQYMLSTSAALESMGHQVSYLWYEDMLPSVRHRGLRRLLVPWAIAMRGLREGGQWDVVEVHEPLGAVYGMLRVLTRRRWLAPLVLLSHGLEGRGWAAQRERARRIRQPIALKSRVSVPLTVVAQAVVAAMTADAVIVLSSTDESHLVNRLRLPRQRVIMAPSGVEEAFLNSTPAATDDEAKDDKRIKIIFVGSWIDRKGTPELCAAWDTLAEDRRLWLTLAGTSASAENILASLSTAHRDRVTVIPIITQEDLRTQLTDHDIFVLPSWFEGMPLSLLEAAACGLPCVATSVCGVRDIFPDGEAEAFGAITIPPHRSDALADALATLIADPTRRAELGRRARQRASVFTWEASAERIALAYSIARGVEVPSVGKEVPNAFASEGREP